MKKGLLNDPRPPIMPLKSSNKSSANLLSLLFHILIKFLKLNVRQVELASSYPYPSLRTSDVFQREVDKVKEKSFYL